MLPLMSKHRAALRRLDGVVSAIFGRAGDLVPALVERSCQPFGIMLFEALEEIVDLCEGVL